MGSRALRYPVARVRLVVCKPNNYAGLHSRPLGPFYIALFRVENGIGTNDPRDGSYLFIRPQPGTSTDLDTKLILMAVEWVHAYQTPRRLNCFKCMYTAERDPCRAMHNPLEPRGHRMGCEICTGSLNLCKVWLLVRCATEHA